MGFQDPNKLPTTAGFNQNQAHIGPNKPPVHLIISQQNPAVQGNNGQIVNYTQLQSAPIVQISANSSGIPVFSSQQGPQQQQQQSQQQPQQQPQQQSQQQQQQQTNQSQVQGDHYVDRELDMILDMLGDDIGINNQNPSSDGENRLQSVSDIYMDLEAGFGNVDVEMKKINNNNNNNITVSDSSLLYVTNTVTSGQIHIRPQQQQQPQQQQPPQQPMQQFATVPANGQMIQNQFSYNNSQPPQQQQQQQQPQQSIFSPSFNTSVRFV